MTDQDPQQASASQGGETLGSWRVSYAPGEWVVLAGPDALVVMPPAPARVTEFVAALWENIVPTVSIDDLVAELGRAGVTDMPDMAALFWDAGSMHSLVRGRLQVVDNATGEVIASGEGVRTWSESGLGHVSSVRIEASDGGPRPDDVLVLPLVVGAVRAHSVLVETSQERLVAVPVPPPRAAVVEPAGPRTGGTSPGAPAGPEHPEPATDHGQVYDPMHPESDEPAHHTGGMAAVAGAGLGVAAVGAGAAAIAAPPPAPTTPAPVAPAPVAPAPVAAAPVEQAPAPAAPGAVGPDSATQVLGGSSPEAATQLIGTGAGDQQQPAPAGQVSADRTGEGPSVEPAPVMALLRPIAGAPVAVDRMVLIGRAPSPDRAGPGVVAKLMTVPSPSHDISRTHVKVEPVGRTVQVTDLHSTNGTVLITGPIGGDPSLAGQRHQLVPGEPVAVQPGWILDLGDGVTILIDRA